MSTSPTPLNKIFATWNECVEKLETIVFKCNLFRIYCGRRVTFIYYYSSLIYSQGTNETSTRKILNPQNALEQKFWTHEMPTRKNFGPTKYLREKISDPRNTHHKKFSHIGMMARDPREPRQCLDPRNLALSLKGKLFLICVWSNTYKACLFNRTWTMVYS